MSRGFFLKGFHVSVLVGLVGCAVPEHLTPVDGDGATDHADADVAGDGDDSPESDGDATPRDADDVTEHDADEPTRHDADEATQEDTGTQPCEDDEHEDNDVRTAATAVTVGGEYEGLRVCSGDDDFYSLELSEGDEITVSIGFSHAEGNINVELLGPLGFVLQSSTSFADSEVITHVAESTGDHFVRVFLASDAGSPGNDYTLSIASEEDVVDCEVDDSEPNDTLEEATDLGDYSDSDSSLYVYESADISTDTDVDWFTAHVEDTAFGTIRIVALLEGLTGDLDLCVSFMCDNEDYASVTCLSDTAIPYGDDTCCSGELETADEDVTMSVMCGSSTFGSESGTLYYTIAGYDGATSCDYDFYFSFGS